MLCYRQREFKATDGFKGANQPTPIWEIFLDSQGVAKVITRALRSESGRQDRSDAERDLKMDEGTTCKGVGVTPRSWKGRDTFCLGPPVGTDSPADTSILAQEAHFGPLSSGTIS